MGKYRCCVPNCDGFRKRFYNPKNTTLHRFPNPRINIERLKTWVTNIGGELLGMDCNNIYRNRRVCRLHFEEKYRHKSGNLVKAAVPTLNIPGFTPSKSDLKFDNQGFNTSKRKELVRNRKRKIDHQDYKADLVSKKVHDKATVDFFQDVMEPEYLDDFLEEVEKSQKHDDEVINMCRICVQSFSKLISIESYGLRTAYEQVTGVSVEHDDGLPRELCVECATLLDKYHKFRDKAIKGDLLLRQIYSKDVVTNKLTAEEIEKVLASLMSNLDYNPEITSIIIDPNINIYVYNDTNINTASPTKEKNTEPNKLSETSDNKVIQTDLDMSVDEAVEEEWLALSDDDDYMRSPSVTSVHDHDDEDSIKAEELNISNGNTDPLNPEYEKVEDEGTVKMDQIESETEDAEIHGERKVIMKQIQDIKKNVKKQHHPIQRLDPKTLLKAFLSKDFYQITPYKGASKWFRRGDHYYTLQRTVSTILPTMYFKCHVAKCRANFKIKEGGLNEVQGEHTHELTPWVPARNRLFHSLKQRARNESMSLISIYEEEALKYPEAAAHMTYDSIHSTMRTMRKLGESDSQPSSLIEFSRVITKHARYKYLVLDTVQTDTSTAIILAMESYTECFNACETVIADVNINICSGTNEFKVLTIFCVVDGHFFYPFFCILENCCQELYEAILKKIWKACGVPQPSNVYVDFDVDLRKAFFNITKVDVEIYLFYFVQALIKKAKLLGAKVCRGTVGWTCIQLYASLALLPPDLILEGLDIVTMIMSERDLHLPNGFHSYFLSEWVDKVGPDSLSMYGRPSRYSLMVEEFHAATRRFMGPNFTLWRFADYVGEKFAIGESRLSSQAVGNLPRRNKDRNYMIPNALCRIMNKQETGQLSLEECIWQVSQKLDAGLD